MNYQEISAFIFDMDGTLLDSMKYWRGENRNFLARRGLPVPDDLEDSIDTMSCHAFARRFVEEHGAPYTFQGIVDEYTEKILTLYQTVIQPKPGAGAFLQKLRARGIPACVATATPRYAAVAALKKQGFEDLLAFVTDDAELGTGKENPAYFLRVAERLDVPPEKCVVFEDSLYAMKGAKAAGMRVLAIEEHVHLNKPELMRGIRETCDHFVRDFYEAAEYLNL